MRPQLKGVVWKRDGQELRLVYDTREHLLIEDPDGTVERLLELLAEGDRPPSTLAEVLNVAVADVQAAVELLDEYRMVEDAERRYGFSARENERYYSNLAFFESFATLAQSREDYQRRLRAAHVLVLGTGGLNSNTIPHLCGLGVGKLTLLDRDRVEARNFARQYLYRWGDIGKSKVAVAADWVRAFDPTIEVRAVEGSVDSTQTVSALLAEHRPDVVMSGVDSPAEVDLWVNAACWAAGIPLVRAGMIVTQGLVWSAAQGRGACRQCPMVDAAIDDPSLDADLASAYETVELAKTRGQVNRGIGPVAGLLGSLAAFEVLRYLTGFEPPAYAGRPLYIDFASGCATQQVEWERDPDCPVCGTGTSSAPSERDDRAEVMT